MDLRSKLKQIVIRLLPLYQKLLVWRLRHKKTINVVFFAMSVPMWRYQHLYELMSKNSRFKVNIVILPTIAYSSEQQNKDEKNLISFFDSKGISYLLGRNPEGGLLDLRKKINPDILFYPQPYHDYYPYDLAYNSFIDKLLCYYPYAFWTSKGYWSYNLPFHNIAWKLFYSTSLHKKDSENLSLRKGRNVEVVGYPNADDFLKEKYNDVWRQQSIKKKRIIWAPHFTIMPGLLFQSNFIWMSDVMIEIAKEYSDKIQFVFKPHPRLFTELCQHPDWGEERAKEYYNIWATMENTQVATGEFVDFFMTSDAMIHDSSSFSVEYHYSGNPILYISKDIEELLKTKNNFGKLSMNLHYVGKTKQDIIDFIENVVLKGNDPMKPQRQQFKQDYLLPPNGKTVAENTMDVFLKAFC